MKREGKPRQGTVQVKVWKSNPGTRVDSELSGIRYLNFTFDESTNTRNERILNVSVSCPKFSLLLMSDYLSLYRIVPGSASQWISIHFLRIRLVMMLH